MPDLVDSLLFRPEYNYFTVRDYTLVDRPGVEAALRAARSNVAASSGEEVVVSCAQGLLKVRVSVNILPPGSERMVEAMTPPADFHFTLPFPSAQLHVGDAFGNALVLDLPSAGHYGVELRYRGREEAEAKSREVDEQFVAMPLVDGMAWLEQWAGIEEYWIVLKRFAGTVSD